MSDRWRAPLSSRCRKAVLLCERGEDSSFEFTAGIVPLVMMILLIAFVSVVRTSQMPAWSAASECARAAIATLDPVLGDAQARRAAMASLEGNHISASAAQISLAGDWSPGSDIVCRVAYNLNLLGIAGFNELTDGGFPIAVEITLRVEPNKSSWQ